MILKPWMPAMEAQLDAFKLCTELMKYDGAGRELLSSWAVDQALLRDAAPYMWSAEVTAAVLEASRSIPDDTVLNKWNLQSPHSWWWFEKPLPFKTVTVNDHGIRALAFGFLKMQRDARDPYAPLPRTSREDFGMPIVAWIDPSKERPPFSHVPFTIAPSQCMEWEDGITLGEMLQKTRRAHDALYGPGGKWEHRPQIGTEEFMQTTAGVARFMLAAMAWIKQKVAVTHDGHIERHRRKELERVTQRPKPAVHVVSLRRAERSEVTREEHLAAREYHVKWVVSGHWRNQVCGPQRGDRRLTYIMPYLKGPDDAPLKSQAKTVYTVDR